MDAAARNRARIAAKKARRKARRVALAEKGRVFFDKAVVTKTGKIETEVEKKLPPLKWKVPEVDLLKYAVTNPFDWRPVTRLRRWRHPKKYPIPVLDKLVQRHFKATRRVHLGIDGEYKALMYMLLATLISPPHNKAVMVIDLAHEFDASEVLKHAPWSYSKEPLPPRPVRLRSRFRPRRPGPRSNKRKATGQMGRPAKRIKGLLPGRPMAEPPTAQQTETDTTTDPHAYEPSVDEEPTVEAKTSRETLSDTEPLEQRPGVWTPVWRKRPQQQPWPFSPAEIARGRNEAKIPETEPSNEPSVQPQPATSVRPAPQRPPQARATTRQPSSSVPPKQQSAQRPKKTLANTQSTSKGSSTNRKATSTPGLQRPFAREPVPPEWNQGYYLQPRRQRIQRRPVDRAGSKRKRSATSTADTSVVPLPKRLAQPKGVAQPRAPGPPKPPKPPAPPKSAARLKAERKARWIVQIRNAVYAAQVKFRDEHDGMLPKWIPRNYRGYNDMYDRIYPDRINRRWMEMATGRHGIIHDTAAVPRQAHYHLPWRPRPGTRDFEPLGRPKEKPEGIGPVPKSSSKAKATAQPPAKPRHAPDVQALIDTKRRAAEQRWAANPDQEIIAAQLKGGSKPPQSPGTKARIEGNSLAAGQGWETSQPTNDTPQERPTSQPPRQETAAGHEQSAAQQNDPPSQGSSAAQQKSSAVHGSSAAESTTGTKYTPEQLARREASKLAALQKREARERAQAAAQQSPATQPTVGTQHPPGFRVAAQPSSTITPEDEADNASEDEVYAEFEDGGVYAEFEDTVADNYEDRTEPEIEDRVDVYAEGEDDEEAFIFTGTQARLATERKIAARREKAVEEPAARPVPVPVAVPVTLPMTTVPAARPVPAPAARPVPAPEARPVPAPVARPVVRPPYTPEQLARWEASRLAALQKRAAILAQEAQQAAERAIQPQPLANVQSSVPAMQPPAPVKQDNQPTSIQEKLTADPPAAKRKRADTKGAAQPRKAGPRLNQFQGSEDMPAWEWYSAAKESQAAKLQPAKPEPARQQAEDRLLMPPPPARPQPSKQVVRPTPQFYGSEDMDAWDAAAKKREVAEAAKKQREAAEAAKKEREVAEAAKKEREVADAAKKEREAAEAAEALAVVEAAEAAEALAAAEAAEAVEAANAKRAAAQAAARQAAQPKQVQQSKSHKGNAKQSKPRGATPQQTRPRQAENQHQGSQDLRAYFTPRQIAPVQGGNLSPGEAAASRTRDAAVQKIQDMFPEADRRMLWWDLQRTGDNPDTTTERFLDGDLETPPATFQPPTPSGPRTGSPASISAQPQQGNAQQGNGQQSNGQQTNAQQAESQQEKPQQAKPQQANSQQANPQQAGSKQAAGSSARRQDPSDVRARIEANRVAAQRRRVKKLTARSLKSLATSVQELESMAGQHPADAQAKIAARLLAARETRAKTKEADFLTTEAAPRAEPRLPADVKGRVAGNRLAAQQKLAALTRAQQRGLFMAPSRFRVLHQRLPDIQARIATAQQKLTAIQSSEKPQSPAANKLAAGGKNAIAQIEGAKGQVAAKRRHTPRIWARIAARRRAAQRKFAASRRLALKKAVRYKQEALSKLQLSCDFQAQLNANRLDAQQKFAVAQRELAGARKKLAASRDRLAAARKMVARKLGRRVAQKLAARRRSAQPKGRLQTTANTTPPPGMQARISANTIVARRRFAARQGRLAAHSKAAAQPTGTVQDPVDIQMRVAAIGLAAHRNALMAQNKAAARGRYETRLQGLQAPGPSAPSTREFRTIPDSQDSDSSQAGSSPPASPAYHPSDVQARIEAHNRIVQEKVAADREQLASQARIEAHKRAVEQKWFAHCQEMLAAKPQARPQPQPTRQITQSGVADQSKQNAEVASETHPSRPSIHPQPPAPTRPIAQPGPGVSSNQAVQPKPGVPSGPASRAGSCHPAKPIAQQKTTTKAGKLAQPKPVIGSRSAQPKPDAQPQPAPSTSSGSGAGTARPAKSILKSKTTANGKPKAQPRRTVSFAPTVQKLEIEARPGPYRAASTCRAPPRHLAKSTRQTKLTAKAKSVVQPKPTIESKPSVQATKTARPQPRVPTFKPKQADASDLKHIYVCRPRLHPKNLWQEAEGYLQTKHVVDTARKFIREGKHNSHDREFWGTIIIGHKRSLADDGDFEADVICGTVHGWLTVKPEVLRAFQPGLTVKHYLGARDMRSLEKEEACNYYGTSPWAQIAFNNKGMAVETWDRQWQKKARRSRPRRR